MSQNTSLKFFKLRDGHLHTDIHVACYFAICDEEKYIINIISYHRCVASEF